MSGTTCGVVIWSKTEQRIKTCGQPATHQLVLRGDNLFATCQRHNRRLARAFPEMMRG